jgi:hypothetical protein
MVDGLQATNADLVQEQASGAEPCPRGRPSTERLEIRLQRGSRAASGDVADLDPGRRVEGSGGRPLSRWFLQSSWWGGWTGVRPVSDQGSTRAPTRGSTGAMVLPERDS